jgi:hypothetical protein
MPLDAASTGQEEELDFVATEPLREPRLLRRVWGGVPARNPGFTGRDDLLATVRKVLLAGDRAVVQALHGMGVVGKTPLAAEYAHRFGDSYDLVWWIAAEQAGLLGEQLRTPYPRATAPFRAALGSVQVTTGLAQYTSTQPVIG